MASQPDFQPGTGSEPTSKIEISISCKGLLDMDVFSRSDPMCVVYGQPTGLTLWEEILRTEVVWDNLDPEFTTKLVIDYRFEEEQKLRFEVYDIDSDTIKKLSDHDFLGFAECPLARIVATGYHGLSLPLSQNQNAQYSAQDQRQKKGTLILAAEELTQLKEEVTVQFQGHSMGSSFLGMCRSKIFFTLSKVNEAGKFVIVHKSEVAPGPNPQWRPLNIGIGSLCGGDHDRGLKVECYKQGVSGYHTLLGFMSTSVTRLITQVGKGALALTNTNGVKVSSQLSVVLCKLAPVYTFIDYIRGGTQMHVCFAIDFTGSNGDPNQQDSLHYISPPELNQTNPYEQAVMAVGEIIMEYNKTKMIPVWGFGARLPPNGVVSHKFNLNLQNPNYFCQGIPDAIDVYRRSIRQVQLWGPTNFSPIIREVAAMALRNAVNNLSYYVLLIVTDGIISDMEETKEAIVNASTLPLSIVIVGVGGADFQAMEVLDGDTVRLSSNGKYAQRDIVQFVPYRDAYSWLQSLGVKVAGTSYANTTRLAKAKLAREVLAEIPAQLTSYMKSQRIAPGGGHAPSAPGFVPDVLS